VTIPSNLSRGGEREIDGEEEGWRGAGAVRIEEGGSNGME
tara:strand:+ start:2339 stop:2458 length:120 start_codon:yes stop_codon:yes gene_type:complete